MNKDSNMIWIFGYELVCQHFYHLKNGCIGGAGNIFAAGGAEVVFTRDFHIIIYSTYPSGANWLVDASACGTSNA